MDLDKNDDCKIKKIMKRLLLIALAALALTGCSQSKQSKKAETPSAPTQEAKAEEGKVSIPTFLFIPAKGKPKGRGAFVLYGRSFDFGPPDFDYVKRIDWSGLGGTPRPLLYLPHWPDETEVIPVIAERE